MSLFTGNAVAQLVFQSDTISKMVLLILFGLSIICWTLFFQRYFLLRLKLKQLSQARSALASVQTLDQLKLLVSTLRNTYSALFLIPAYDLLQERLASKTESSEQEKEFFSQQLYALYDDLIKKETASLTLFTAAIEVSPLLGLFGTIWGLVHSFIRISERQSADIVTVAPGIAEALITTLAGLVVAIPALVLYQLLLHNVGRIEDRLIVLTDRYEIVAKKLWQKEFIHAHTQISSPEKSDIAASKPYTFN
ncbi:MAG: MotA/TolQ/ExbB proton channel family protein [Candidatus Babeliaceae bacterium]|nr:MotA/TolQ/ExbB proton channel family protein [Candidatus Babeliaceae bacterium]